MINSYDDFLFIGNVQFFDSWGIYGRNLILMNSMQKVDHDAVWYKYLAWKQCLENEFVVN